jgi:type IV pilus assembly protein PilA
VTSSQFVKRMRQSAGFTLIELLLAVGILGVLAAIAIQQYALFRQRSFDAIAEADLRNAGTAEEAAYIRQGTYLTCDDAAACETALPGYTRSNGVLLAMTSSGNAFTGTSSHVNGAKTWNFDTTDGRLIYSTGP